MSVKWPQATDYRASSLTSALLSLTQAKENGNIYAMKTLNKMEMLRRAEVWLLKFFQNTLPFVRLINVHFSSSLILSSLGAPNDHPSHHHELSWPSNDI